MRHAQKQRSASTFGAGIGRATAGLLLGAVLIAPAARSATESLAAAQERAEAAGAVVAEWVAAERIPGAVLLISRDDRIVFERAYGWAQLSEYRQGQYGAAQAGEARPDAIRRLDEPRPMTADTVFDLASVTKVMATTFAVMLLVDDGELDLDAPLHTYLPDFRGGGKEAITLRHLLTHRAGLYQWQPIYYAAADAGAAYAYIRDLPLAWGVGEGRHYSDLGFMLLGLVVERVAGKPLGAFLHDRLYGPLGLSATGFRPPGGDATATSPSRATNAAAVSGDHAPGPPGPFAATSHGNPYEHHMVHDPDFGYRYAGDPNGWDGWRRYTLAGEVNDGNAFHAFGGVAGHAGLFSTAAELRVLLQLLLDEGTYGGRRYLSSAVVADFLTPTGDGQALGWQVPRDLPAGSFSHPGFTGTWVLGVPAQGLAVVLLTNRQNLGLDARGYYPDLGELQRRVTEDLVEGPRDVAARRPYSASSLSQAVSGVGFKRPDGILVTPIGALRP